MGAWRNRKRSTLLMFGNGFESCSSYQKHMYEEYEESEGWGEEVARIAKKATREAFERHKKAGRGPAILVGNEIRKIWADDSYTVIKVLDNLEERCKIPIGIKFTICEKGRVYKF